MSILLVRKGGYNTSYKKLLSDNLVFAGHLISKLVNALQPDQMQSRKFQEFPLPPPFRFFLENRNEKDSFSQFIYRLVQYRSIIAYLAV